MHQGRIAEISGSYQLFSTVIFTESYIFTTEKPFSLIKQNSIVMKKLIPIFLLLLPFSSCIGFHHRDPFNIFGFIYLLLILAMVIWAFNRVSRSPTRHSRRRNFQILLIIAGVLILWPIIGFVILPILAISMGLFFFFPPLLLIAVILILLLSRRDR